MIEIKDLPKGWTIAKLGDLVITEKGKKPKRVSKEMTKECSIPYVNIKAFEKNIIDEYTDGVGCVLCEDDDFLMVWDGSRSGYVGKAIKGALGSTLVRIKLPLVNQDLTYYFLKSKFIEINSRAKGVGIPHVDPNLLWNYDFPLSPLNEQKRILAKLEQLLTDLDKGIEYLETTKQQLKVYRQAVLKWAFEGNWELKPLGKVAIVKRGKSKHRPRNAPELFGGKYPFIQTGDVRAANGRIVKEYSETYSDFGLKQSKLWPKGTLCLTIAANIADTAFLGFDACFPDSVVGITSDPSVLNLEYVNFYIQKIKQEIEGKASATAQKNINVEFLEALEIPVPNPIQQVKIVHDIESRLSVCDKIEETIERSLQQAEALRLSIIKKAFEGKLVPQDPNDEPAEKLLERIRALRQAQGKHGNGKPEKKEKVKTSKRKILVNG
ncbi:MAG: hypothetical protein EKK39_12040 [Sphingobacteriales bacterium]|uniref:restriction endonuclease subunit S n=1 Tax=Hydrotalea flava TaxID=714549 RepID=UPI00083621BA|nr:restriction endonuclease subunit S [Hydrotalea flava]RTL48804.1 MAG: hypothetical protein EKK39_12040 [Sphingobacteriales bacterium]